MRFLHNLVFSPWQLNDVYANTDSQLYPDTQHAENILGKGFSCDVVAEKNTHTKHASDLRIIHNINETSGEAAVVFFAGKGGTVLGNVNEKETTLYSHDGETHTMAAGDIFTTRKQCIKDIQEHTGLPVIAPILDRRGSFGKKVRNQQFAAILDHCQEKGISVLHMTGESMGANDALAFANYALEHKEKYNITVGSVGMAVPFDTLAHAVEAVAGSKVAERIIMMLPMDRLLNNVTMLDEVYKKMHTDETVAFPLTVVTAGEKDSIVPTALQLNALESAKAARDGAQVKAEIHHIDNPTADHFLWDTSALAHSVARAEEIRQQKSAVPETAVINITMKGLLHDSYSKVETPLCDSSFSRK